MPDELLTVAEIAERLKLNAQTIRNWIDLGELSSIRLGSRRVRVLESELARFIAESSSARSPTVDSARQTYAEALQGVPAATGDADEAAALRRLAKASTALARVLAR